MMKKAIVLFCLALVSASVAFGGVISEEPGELSVSGQLFLPDHADGKMFDLAYGASVSYREWFSFPWGVGVNLGISQWQVEDNASALKIEFVNDYDGDVMLIPLGASLYFNVIDWDKWNVILETGLQYAFVQSNADAYNTDKQKRQDIKIGGSLLWNIGAEYEYMISEKAYITAGLGYQIDIINGDSKFDGKSVRDITFGAGYGRLGAKFLF